MENQENNKETNITINGITFTTQEAFAKYREDHTFRVGDAVNVMTNEYTETKVCPGLITGINDFGEGKVTLEVAYIGGYGNELHFGEIYSDECGAKTCIKGIAPINEFNDLRMKLTDCIARMEQEVARKEGEVAAIQKHISRLRNFAEKVNLDM